MPDLMTAERPSAVATAPIPRVRLTYSASFNQFIAELAYYKSCRVSEYLRQGATHDGFGNYISYRNGLLTYTPKGKVAELEEHGREWKRKDRQEGKPARVARAILHPDALANLNDQDFERFANHVKATDPNTIGTIELVSGKNIRHWYLAKNNESGAFGSCMSYDKCQSWFGIYEENSKCHLLVIHKDGKAAGRALVWETDKGWVIDRIYASTAARVALTNYANDQGWQSVERNNGGPYTVQLEKTFFKAYPYIDSFQYVNHAKKTLCNIGVKGQYDQSLGYANGGPHPNFTCRRCHGAFEEDQLTVHEAIGALCPKCAKKVVCRYCGTVRADMPDAGCAHCVAIRTCECGVVDQDPLTDKGSGRLCAACNALGAQGIAAKRRERAEAARRAREEAERIERERLAEIERRAQAQRERERKQREAQLEYEERNRAWMTLRNANRNAIRQHIEDGPAVLYETFHYATEAWVRDAFYEHPLEAYTPLSYADLRRLLKNVAREANRIMNMTHEDYYIRIYTVRYGTRAYLSAELERIKTCTDRVKVPEVRN